MEKIKVSHCGRGVIRVVDKYQLGSLGDVGGDRTKIRQKRILFHQRHKIRFTTCKHGGNVVNRVSWGRYEGHVSRVDIGEWKVCDALFAAYQ